MFIKILLVGVLVFAAMAAVRDGRLLAKAGCTASCTEVSTRKAQDDVVQACTRGRHEGYPDLKTKSCVSLGIRHRVQYWSCPAPVVSSQTPRA